MKFAHAQMRNYLLIILTGLALILSADYLGFFEGINNHCHDLLFRLRGPDEPDRRILIAAIDERTLDRLGRWPLRRIHYASLLDKVTKAGVVGFDIIMAEPTEDDAALIEAIRRQGRVVFPSYIDHSYRAISTSWHAAPLRAGHVHLEQDIDGVVRRVYHTLYIDGRKIPSFTSLIYETLTGKGVPREKQPDSTGKLNAQSDIIQFDSRRINYYGGPGTFPQISLVDIIDGRYPPEFFTNRIILVGLTAEGLNGRVLTPFSQLRNRMTGIEAHANILNNLLDGKRIVDASASSRWISVCLSLLGVFLFLKADGRRMALWWLLGIVFAYLSSFVLFVRFDLWFSPIIFSISISFMFVAAYIFKLEQAGRELGEAKDEWEESFNTINDAIVLMDCKGRINRMNETARAMLGPRMLDILTWRCRSLQEALPLPSEVGENGHASMEEADPVSGRHFEIKSLPRFSGKDECIGVVHVVRDITGRKKAEEEKELFQFQFLQSQKMESIGRLAGGVAHDFNNILTAILGYSEIALKKMSQTDPLRNNIKIINDAGMKAAALTRQLLVFSRKQVVELQVVNVKEIVDNLAKILGRVIGEDVTLRLRTEKPVKNILADPGYLEQIIMNLAVNARDAMPHGGTLTIETDDVELDEEYARSHAGVVAGPHVMLSVTDMGIGMSPEVRARIFEPFFTTKKVGEGTGLGLSTVSDIIKQMSGHIYVYSELGKGSVFKIYLPACRQDAGARTIQPETPALARGKETVLVAEDDPITRRLIVDLLESLGYTVLAAGTGREALRLFEDADIKCDILLTDVVMPEMSGKELAQNFQKKYPYSKVLFMSGYTEEIVIQQGLEQGGVAFIQKPLIPNKLSIKLREVLDGEMDMRSG